MTTDGLQYQEKNILKAEMTHAEYFGTGQDHTENTCQQFDGLLILLMATFQVVMAYNRKKHWCFPI